MTRRGAAVVGEMETASAVWQKAIARARQNGGDVGTRAGWEPEVWVRDDGGSPEGAKASARRQGGRDRLPPGGRRKSHRLPPEVLAELARVGGPQQARRLQGDLAEAAQVFDAGRYVDALRVLAPLARSTPAAASVRELHGLTLYRLGRWRAALRELEAAHQLTGAFDQYPVMADCHRALGCPERVEELWDELRHAPAGGDVVAEGRIVLAGSLADRGDIAGAIALLGPFGVARARPKAHHLRTWYALADLYERAGDASRARGLFQRLVDHDASFHDVLERLAAL